MRYLFCVLASHGYVYPAMGLALSLQERGHDVAFVTGDTFQPTLKEAGIQTILYPGPDKTSFQVPHWGDMGEVLRQVQHTTFACESYSPDIVVCSQLAIGPLIVARRLNLPVAVLGFAAYPWPTTYVPYEQQTDLQKGRWWLHDAMLKTYDMVYNRVIGYPFRNNSLSDGFYQQSPLLGDLYLLRSVPELETQVDTLPPKVHFVGDCNWEPLTSMDEEFLTFVSEAAQNQTPMIFVQYFIGGGIPDYLPSLAEAFRDQPVRFVVATGHHDISLEAPNFLVRKFVPHTSIMPYTQLVVNPGTSSVMLGALTHGCPLLLFPFSSEHPEIAERCVQAGVALCLSPFDRYTGTPLPENITPEKVRQAVYTLIAPDSPYKHRASQLQSTFSELRELQTAVNLLEQLALQDYKTMFQPRRRLVQEEVA